MSESEASNSEPGTVGSMEVVFESCSRDIVKYNMPELGLAGEIPIQRIADDNEAFCQTLSAQ